jgi:hypothetical protein
MPRHIDWTPAADAELLAGHAAGRSAAEMAAEMQQGSRNVQRRLRVLLDRAAQAAEAAALAAHPPAADAPPKIERRLSQLEELRRRAGLDDPGRDARLAAIRAENARRAEAAHRAALVSHEVPLTLATIVARQVTRGRG